MANERNMVWNYPLLSTSESKQGQKTFTPKDFSYETVGVDFSTKGGLRPFPGFKKAHEFTSLPGETYHGDGSEVIDVFPVSFRIGTDYFGYGFVYRAKQDAGEGGSDTSKADIFLDYYIKGVGWTRGYNISSGASGSASKPMEVTVFGRYIYIMVKGQEPILFYVKYEPQAAATAQFTVATYGNATAGVKASKEGAMVITNVSNLLATTADTVTIVTTEGTTITCTAHASTTSSLASTNSGTFAATGSTSDTATNLATLLNSHPALTATADGAEVDITQNVPGAAGNVTPVYTDNGSAGMTVSALINGVTGDKFSFISTAGTTHTAYAVNVTGVNFTATGTFGTFKVETSNNQTASNFATCVNASNSFAAAVQSSPNQHKVTLTQATVGSGGNTVTTLTETDSSVAFTKSNFSGGTGTAGSDYNAFLQTDTGPGKQVEIISPNSTDSVTVGTLADPASSVPGHAQVFTSESAGTHWDSTPEDMDDLADLEAGNYAVGFVLADPDSGRKTSLSELAQVKREHLVSKATGTVTFNDDTEANYNGESIVIGDGTNSVTFTMDDTTSGAGVKVDSQNYTVKIDTAANAVAIAALFHTTLNLANTNGDLKITSSNSSSAVCNLTHVQGTTEGNVDITVTTTGADISVSGMSNASNFDPGRIGMEIVYDSSKFSQAYIYRSVRTQDAGGSYSASIVQLDKIINLADYLTTDQTGITGNHKRAIYYFRLPDLALIYQDPYIDRSVFDEDMPKAGTGIEFDGIFLTSDIEGSADQSASGQEGSFDKYRGLGEFRWSSMAETSPELFPPENYHVPSKISNQVIRFVRSGSVVLGFANNVIMHISREFSGVSSFMKVLPIHEGFGIVNRKALQTVGPFTYYINDKGIKTVDAQARLDSLHVLDGLIEDWKTNFSSLSMAYDAQGSVLFVLNSAENKAGLLWMNTASASELHDMPFSEAVTGPWPSDLSDADSDLTERAFFVQNQPSISSPNSNFKPCVWVMDTKREKTIANSAASDFNGKSRVTLLDGEKDTRFRISAFDSSAKTITIDISTTGHQSAVPALAADPTWVGAYVYIVGVADVANESRIGEKAQIKSLSAVGGGTVNTITYLDGTQTSGFTLSAGDRIAISPVYMKWNGTLLGYNDPVDPQSPTPTGLHIARTIDSIGAYFSTVSGAAFTDSVNTKDCFFKGSIYEGDSTTPASSSVPVDLSNAHIRSIAEGESTYWAGFETHGVRGIAASPSIEVFCPDLDFRLLSAIIEGKIIPTFRTERPS
tara:strand:+ start:57 stop:3842 length:3786 start_codon:yes stop_codon:yes gene_type:complete